MTRNLKILGTASVAVLVLAAAMASSAVADEFRSEGNQAVKLTGAQTTKATFATTAGNAECTGVKYAGTLAATPTASMTLTPTWTSCTCLGLGCTVENNGCVIKLDIAGATTGTANLECGANELTFVSFRCTLHVKTQSTLSTVTYKNVGTGATREIEVVFELKNISYTHTEGDGFSACTTGSSKTGTLGGTVLLTGETDTMTPAHVGIFVQ